MHDANRKELKIGDIVLIPAKITSLSPTEEYCNVAVESVYGRRPDEAKETFGAINTAVLLRYNQNDTIGYSVLDSVRE